LSADEIHQTKLDLVVIRKCSDRLLEYLLCGIESAGLREVVGQQVAVTWLARR